MPDDSQQPDTAQGVLGIVNDLVVELHPRRRDRRPIRPDATLDRDLGIDSLGRVELFLRLEKTFGVALPQQLLQSAETVQQLVDAVSQAPSRGPAVPLLRAESAVEEAVAATPSQARTLTEMLDCRAEAAPDRVHIFLEEDDESETPITYAELAREARTMARGLRSRGFAVGDRAALMLPTCREFFTSFFGILYAGGTPVPIYPPMRMSQLEDHLSRQAAILRNAGITMMIADARALTLTRFLKAKVPTLREVDAPQGFAAGPEDDSPLPKDIAPEQIALLQYTSGSTGDPKGVVLTHANLLANVRAMGEAIDAGPADVFVSWLPLYHDMGLIGAWLGSLYSGVTAVIMSPLSFLARPGRWLRAIHRRGGTLTAAPNFAYELCLHKVGDEEIEGLDLSSLRMAMNGAEPVVPDTIRKFVERFAGHGLSPEAMAPVYGMAENSVGLSFPAPGEGPTVDRVRRNPLCQSGRAVPAEADDPDGLEFVACGRVVSGHQVRILDSTGREVGDRIEGRLQFRGPSACRGYYENPEKTRELFDGEWLESGDLAYTVDGLIFLTGRAKDMIIRAGRNIHPHQVEAAVGEIEGVRKGCVAVFGSADSRSGTERVVVAAETKAVDEAARSEIRRRIEQATLELLDAAADETVLLPPRSLPKTSSGKIRRAAARSLYEADRLGRGRPAVWRQWVSLEAGAWLPSLRRLVRGAAGRLYGVYCWVVFAVAAMVGWPIVVLAPGRDLRWRLTHFVARALFRLCATRLQVRGLANIPKGGAVVAANHSSYLDGLILTAALPDAVSFVAKRELEGQPVVGRFLRRIGALFVERASPGNALAAGGEAVETARQGGKLLFFPEATFRRAAGLLDFRLGAFVVASEAGVPVVPATIRGARSLLRDGQWLPRRTAITVEVCSPISPQGTGFSEAIRLRDAARAEILSRCGEPDLAEERAVFTESGVETVRF